DEVSAERQGLGGNRDDRLDLLRLSGRRIEPCRQCSGSKRQPFRSQHPVLPVFCRSSWNCPSTKSAKRPQRNALFAVSTRGASQLRALHPRAPPRPKLACCYFTNSSVNRPS